MANKKQNKRKKTRRKNQSTPIIVVGIALIVLSIFIIGNADAPIALAREVTVNHAYQLREDGAFILDVREPSEWNEKHIPGSTLIPLGELSNRVNEIPQGQDIVVICRSGNRSQTGRDILLNAGFDNVTSVSGGINLWIASGYDFVTGP